MESLSTMTSPVKPRAKTLAELAAQLDRIESLLTDRETNKPLTLKQAAEYLSLSASTLYKMTSANKIRYSKPGKRVFFQRADLNGSPLNASAARK